MGKKKFKMRRKRNRIVLCGSDVMRALSEIEITPDMARELIAWANTPHDVVYVPPKKKKMSKEKKLKFLRDRRNAWR